MMRYSLRTVCLFICVDKRRNDAITILGMGQILPAKSALYMSFG